MLKKIACLSFVVLGLVFSASLQAAKYQKTVHGEEIREVLVYPFYVGFGTEQMGSLAVSHPHPVRSGDEKDGVVFVVPPGGLFGEALHFDCNMEQLDGYGEKVDDPYAEEKIVEALVEDLRKGARNCVRNGIAAHKFKRIRGLLSDAGLAVFGKIVGEACARYDVEKQALRRCEGLGARFDGLSRAFHLREVAYGAGSAIVLWGIYEALYYGLTS